MRLLLGMSWMTMSTAAESLETLKVEGMTENSPGSILPETGSSLSAEASLLAASALASSPSERLALRAAMSSLAPDLSWERAWSFSLVDWSRLFCRLWALEAALCLRKALYF